MLTTCLACSTTEYLQTSQVEDIHMLVVMHKQILPSISLTTCSYDQFSRKNMSITEKEKLVLVYRSQAHNSRNT